MARTLYKSIAAVLFVLVTIQYFYFYPFKTGSLTTNSPISSIPITTTSSIQQQQSQQPPAAADTTATHFSSYLEKHPHENSVFYILSHFNPPKVEEEENESSNELPVPQQEPHIIHLLKQANSRLNQSSSLILPNHTNDSFPKRLKSLEEKVNFVSNISNSNNSRSSSLVSNFIFINETQSINFSNPHNMSNTTEGGISKENSTKLSSPLPLCPSVSPLITGFNHVRLQAPSLADIGRQNPDLDLGGHYKPSNCVSRSRVAIIVPFRDREEHLRIFLHNLIPMLKRQQIEFNVFVVEQGGSSKNEPFNRAMLFNVGFVEANKRYQHWQCFIFHDVDLIPENDYNLYNCPVQPRHMSVAVDKMKYKLPYKTIFGGISALTKEHFKRVNGFSNMFWGWGAEDDDMAGRIAFHGLFISRPSPSVARYKMLKHRQQKLNTQRYKVLQKGKHRFNSDGLSNLNYTVEQIILERTHTLVRVQLFRVGEGG